MDIWMDMTNSLQVWNGGVVGIIRAELEIAYFLKKNYPNIKFSKGNGHGFEEIKQEELSWLWEADSVADAYMNKMGRNIGKTCNTDKSRLIEKPQGLVQAYEFSTSRRERLREAGKRYIGNKSPKIRTFLKVIFYMGFAPISMGSRIRSFVIKKLSNAKSSKNINNVSEHEFKYPFKENDIVFSCGWYTSNKEYLFSKVKSEIGNLSIVYLIYDIILIKEGTSHLYDKNPFDKYVKWISNNCDMILYGGNTAKRDTEKYLESNNLNIPNGFPIKFGAEIVRSSNDNNVDEVLMKLGVESRFIMAVGSIEPRKNYDTIYRAYVLLLEQYEEQEIPQFVIVGGAFGENNLLDCIKLDPRLKKKIITVRPSDEELDILYKKCLFTLLPSLYEGWSLTLPEALGYKKLCLASKVDPLIEIGENLTEFVEPLDPREWARKIMYFVKNPNEVTKYERKIEKSWVPITWNDCSVMILNNLLNLKNNKTYEKETHLYYDLTLAWNLSNSGAFVSGILRTQLILARYIARLCPNLKYVAITPDGCINIDKYTISEILENGDIETAYENCKYFLAGLKPVSHKENMGVIQEEIKAVSGSFWLLCSVLPHSLQDIFIKKGRAIRDKKLQKAIEKTTNNTIPLETTKVPFTNGDIILSTGTGFDEVCYPILVEKKREIGFRFIQLIYDFTPTLLPQVHMEQTRKYYTPFLKNTSELSDYILYGGKTAMRDGIEYFERNNLPVKPGYPIMFGSNIVGNKADESNDKNLLRNLGIKREYILTVGSIEIRKNHETLYKAYLKMLELLGKNTPQMVFAGYPGWKTKELINMLMRDKRIENKILVVTPSDNEMAALYRNCKFTVLPSLYEGWSLTLPESLNYGKFCIASDVDPLREIGQDYIEYVHPFDTMKWADRIMYYLNNNEELKMREEKIKNEWHSITWGECAQQVCDTLKLIIQES